MNTHRLKTWSNEFKAVAAGLKRNEFRLSDRKYQTGDTLLLEEFDHCDFCGGRGCMGHGEYICCCPKCNGNKGCYTGEVIECVITHITQGGTFGIPECYVSMTIKTKGDEFAKF